MGRSRASKEQMGMNQAPCNKSNGGSLQTEKAKPTLLRKQAQMAMRNKGEKSQ
jgi:hypothetical protein